MYPRKDRRDVLVIDIDRELLSQEGKLKYKCSVLKYINVIWIPATLVTYDDSKKTSDSVSRSKNDSWRKILFTK